MMRSFRLLVCMQVSGSFLTISAMNINIHSQMIPTIKIHIDYIFLRKKCFDRLCCNVER